MPKYTVKFTGLTDIIAYVEVEADNPQQAVELATEHLEPEAFDLPDDGVGLIDGTQEAVEVMDDDQGENVLTLPQTCGDAIAEFIQSPGDLAELREAIRGVKIMDNAGNFKQWDDEPWLAKVRAINLPAE